MKLSEGTKKVKEAIHSPRFGEVVRKIRGWQKKVEKAVNTVLLAGVVGGAAFPMDTKLTESPLAKPPAVQTDRKIIASYEHNGNLTHLRESGVLPEKQKWAITANGEAFSELAETFYEAPATKELLEKEALLIVYPGSGIHLAPIEMTQKIAEKSSTVKEIDLTYTEVSPEAYRNIDKALKAYLDHNTQFSNFKLETEEPPTSLEKDFDSPRRKIMTFSFTTSDRREVKMKLDFQYKMSGEKWFQPHVGNEADLFILHDSNGASVGSGKAKLDIGILLENLDASSVPPQKMFAVVMDDEKLQQAHNQNNLDAFSTLGNVVATQNGLPYGCGENHWDEQERHEHDLTDSVRDKIGTKAVVIEIDMSGLHEIKKLGGNDALIAYASLADIWLNNDSKLPTLDQYQALLNVSQKTTNRDLKNKIKELAEHNLKNFNLPFRERLIDSTHHKMYKVLESMTTE